MATCVAVYHSELFMTHCINLRIIVIGCKSTVGRRWYGICQLFAKSTNSGVLYGNDWGSHKSGRLEGGGSKLFKQDHTKRSVVYTVGQ